MVDNIVLVIAIVVPAAMVLGGLGIGAYTLLKPSLSVRRLEARAAAGDPEAKARLERGDAIREAARRAMGAEDPERERILTSGRAARATLTDVRPTGMTVSASAVPAKIVEVDLVIEGGAGSPITVRDAVSELHLGRLQKGASVPVRVDPLRPDHVVVLWDTL